jgi:hypothetical protein
MSGGSSTEPPPQSGPQRTPQYSPPPQNTYQPAPQYPNQPPYTPPQSSQPLYQPYQPPYPGQPAPPSQPLYPGQQPYLPPRCLNCGKYRVSYERVKLDPKTGRPVEKAALGESIVQAIMLYILGSVVLFVIGVVYELFNCSAAGCTSIPPLLNVGCWLGAILLVYGWPTYVLVRWIYLASRNASLPWTHLYTCADCGYKWSQR